MCVLIVNEHECVEVRYGYDVVVGCFESLVYHCNKSVLFYIVESIDHLCVHSFR